MPSDTTLELKSASLDHAVDDLMRAFEEFKDTNETRLTEIERRSSPDPLTSEKLDRLGQALDSQRRVIDDLVHKSARPKLGGAAASPLAREHKAVFEGYVRRGEAGTLRSLEQKALSVGSDPDGGYLVPEETERAINGALRDISPIRAIAGVRQVSGSVFKKPFSVNGPGTGWVGESAARPETQSPTLAELAFPTMELYAMPAATQSLLEDAAIDLDAWIAGEVEIAFAEQESAAFISGDGVNKPRGFLDYPVADEAIWSWGNLGYMPTGVSGAFQASNASDTLIETIYALKAGYRQNANWVMNRKTQAEIRKLKDVDGNYLWQPPAAAGERAMLMGFPLVEAEDMPDIAANSLSIAFGDFSRGYLVVDRMGVRVLRDPYSAKPYVLFYTTKRVGGGVQDFDAIKLIRFGTA